MRHAFVGLIFLLAITAVGCGGPVGNSSGIVRFDDGQAVESGSIEFRSLGDKSLYASRIGQGGTFTLVDAEGQPRCPAGEYEVVVVQIVLTEDLAAEDHSHGTTVPRKYADYYTSGLRVTRAEADMTPIEITLVADPD